MNTARLHEPVGLLEPAILAPLRREPLVSILLTNYNYARYICDAIESVLRQTYANWELVICDDGSTDESVSLIKQYVAANPRITLIEKANGGHTSALNRAFSECCGSVVCLLDSDDLFTPDKLQRLVDIYLEDSQIGMVVHTVIRVNRDRRRQGIYPLTTLPGGWLGKELLTTGGIIPCAPPTSAITFRREIGDAVFPISLIPPFHMCPDQVIMRLAPFLTVIQRASRPLAEHRVHDGNAYSLKGLCLPAVSKQLQISRALWSEQHRFLSEISPNIAKLLKDHDQSQNAALLKYIEAKLAKSSDTRPCLDKYLALCKAGAGSKWMLFWRISIYLPNFLFQRFVSTLLGQGMLKQIVSRLRGIA
jgi:glycosyltransferase involved in cell wall biosynthesis